jgi:hypothetical protein
MPPWFIERNVGIQKYKDDISLSDEEIARIVNWVDSGAPLGNPADMPPPRTFDDANKWTIGTPDLIVSTPVANIKAVSPDWWTNHGPIPSGLTEDRYISAVETKPTAESLPVVHHAGVSMARLDREVDRGEVQDAEASGSGSQISLYEIGRNAEIYPANSGRLMKADTKFSFSMHYHSIGKEVNARTEVGLKFFPKGQVPKYVLDFHYIGNTYELDIPPGRDNIRTDGYTLLPRPARVGSFEPHMHTRGVRQCLEAVYPDGRIETLGCARYNHNWVKTYAYQDDVAPLLPAGTILHNIGWYDNTSKNPRNMDSRNWAGWGNRTIDDMSITFVNLTWFTDEQFKQELADRKAKTAPPTQNHQQ